MTMMPPGHGSIPPYTPYYPSGSSFDATSAYPGATPEARSASVWLWVSAGLLLAASTCCGVGLWAFGVLPIEEFKKQDATGSVPQETWDALATLQPQAPFYALLTAMLMVLPAAVLLVLAFGVRKGRQGQTLAALWVLSVPLTLLTLMLLLSLLGGLASQGVLTALSNALPLAMGVALLAWTWVALRNARRASMLHPGEDAGTSHKSSSLDDPWERTL